MPTELENILNSITALKERHPNVPVARLVTAYAEPHGVVYCSDKDLSIMLADAVAFGKCQLKSLEADLYSRDAVVDSFNMFCDELFYDIESLTKEREGVAYNRYKHTIRGCPFIDMSQEMPMEEFIKFLPCEFADICIECYSFGKYTVINHVTSFPNNEDYRHFLMYCINKSDNLCEFKMHITSKLPEYYELFRDVDSLIDTEGIVLVFDSVSGTVRADIYAERVLFGISVNKPEKKLEILDRHHAVEMFHELYQRCEKQV